MKKYILIFLLFTVSFVINAQSIISFGAGAIAYGKANVKFQTNSEYDDAIKFKYMPLYGGAIFCEQNADVVLVREEVAFCKGNCNEFASTYSNTSYMLYVGKDITSSKNRFQLPLYYGLGLSRMGVDGEIKKIWRIGFKSQMKLYVSENICVYLGGSYLGFSQHSVNAEAGITYTLSRKIEL